MALLSEMEQALLSKVDGHPKAMLNFARTFLLPRGKTAEALAVVERALQLTPDDSELQAIAQSVRSHGVGGWYFTMVQDDDRHALYASALAQQIAPGDVVLDIGAGTGLFAMMAARAGAGQVIACERHVAVATAAAKVVEANGLSGQVALLGKSSTELEIGQDLPERADVLLWDNLANNVLGAGAAKTIEDARRRLLKPDAKIMPARAEIVVALAENKRLADHRMEDVSGFDLSAFNAVSPSPFTAKRQYFERRSEPATLFTFDFSEDVPSSGRATCAVRSSGGRVNGVVQWARFFLGTDIVYETNGATVTAFGEQFHGVASRETAASDAVAIGGSHDGESTWFWLEQP